MKKLLEISLDQYPTHVAITDNKTKANRHLKINSQLLYNQKLSKFSRAIAISNLHRYIASNLPNKVIVEYPVFIKYTIFAPINYGDVSRRKKNGSYYISWKKPNRNYVPSNDLDNMSVLWVKVCQDCLTKSKIIINDTLQFINEYSVKFEPVEELDDRSILIEIFKR